MGRWLPHPGGKPRLGEASYGRDFHQDVAQDLVESHHSDDGDCNILLAVELIIFGTRESAVQVSKFYDFWDFFNEKVSLRPIWRTEMD